MKTYRWVLSLVLGAAAPSVGCAGEDFYVMMFGAQTVPSDPKYSHSFATFVRVYWEGDGPCPDNPKLEAHTISWLASSGVIRLCALLPEDGTNFGLDPTLRWCQGNCMRVSLWGPYKCCPELYHRAMDQLALLESGQVRYKAIDTCYSNDQVSNCIHALRVLEGPRIRVATPGWGETASFAVLEKWESHIEDRNKVYPWVGSALGLDDHPIIYRDWQSPRSGAFGCVYRLLGGERNLRATYGPPAP